VILPPPPTLASLRAGHALHTPWGLSTVMPDLDFETYSEAGCIWDEAGQKWVGPPGSPQGKKGLPVVAAAAYAEHPSTEVLCLAYDLKDGAGPRQWVPGMPPPVDLWAHVMGGGLLEAHNVGFERKIWQDVCVRRLGWPPVTLDQWRCSLAKCRAYALPPSLDQAGEVMQITHRKDTDGGRLLTMFSLPRKPTKGDPRRRIRPSEAPEDGPRLYAYNRRDIEAEAELSSLVPDLPPAELAYWQADQAINARGVHIDRDGLRDCIAVVGQVLEHYNTELRYITGGTVARASELAKLTGWLGAQGVHVTSLDEDGVDEALSREGMPPAARRALEIRQAAGSASVKKVYAMENQATAANRLHDLFTFNGARTGRPTGSGPQPTNLPSGGPEVIRCGCGRHHAPTLATCPWCGVPVSPVARRLEWCPEAVEDALLVMRGRDFRTVERVFGHALATVSGCLRGLYCAAPGHDLVSSDYSAIEAVVLAYLAGERWRMDVFETHGKIYEASASTMYKVPFEEFERVKRETGNHHPLRKKGKVAELGFGFQGWIGAAKAFGMPGTDEEIKADILAWRAASPAIEWFWGGQTRGKANGPLANAGRPVLSSSRWDDTPHYFGVEGAAVQAVLNPGTRFEVTRLDGSATGVSYQMRGGVLSCELRSGRRLYYHRPALRPSTRNAGEWSLSFWGYNTNPKNGPVGWICMDTWGGRLVENIVQATANDVLRYATINLEAAGYPLVLHVYDEIVSEIPQGWGDLLEFERIMGTMPSWAHGWPIKAAGGWRGRRYRKG
jgi:DNA polymerase bacteriophage-type